MSPLSKSEGRRRGRAAGPADLVRRERLSASVRDHLADRVEFKEAGQVALFCGRDWEVDLRPLWALRPEACVFPRSSPPDKSLAFYSVDSLEALGPGYAGILEPPAAAARRVTSWRKDDLILVPGLLFDRQGGRVGSGHGYYDRFLATIPSLRWGVGFAAQLAKEGLAQDPTDVRMDALVTEQGLIRIG